MSVLVSGMSWMLRGSVPVQLEPLPAAASRPGACWGAIGSDSRDRGRSVPGIHAGESPKVAAYNPDSCTTWDDSSSDDQSASSLGPGEDEHHRPETADEPEPPEGAGMPTPRYDALRACHRRRSLEARFGLTGCREATHLPSDREARSVGPGPMR